MKIKIYDIDWDTDGEIIEDLPTEIIVEDSAVGSLDDVADYLSDEYGFCVFSFIAEIV